MAAFCLGDKMKNKSINFILEVTAIGMIVGLCSYIAFKWTSIPAVIPIHFDLAGNADGYGSKMHILFMVAVTCIMYAVVALCQKNPRSWNIPVKIDEDKKERAYSILKTIIIALKCEVTANFVYLTICMVGGRSGSPWFTLGFLAVVIITLIIGIYKCKK